MNCYKKSRMREKMKILYLRNTRQYHLDVIEVLKKRGHQLMIETIADDDREVLKGFTQNRENNLLQKIQTADWDILFSLDYYPCISMLCETIKKRYVSWCLEPPFSNLYSSSIINSGNLIFTADRWLAESFRKEGISNISYLSEGVNIDRCNRIREELKEEKDTLKCSMIGEIREPSWQELFQTEHLLDATLGYLEGLTASQALIYGYDFWQNRLPEYLYHDLVNNSKLRPGHDSIQEIQQYYAEQCFYPKTTAVDRNFALKVLSKVYRVNICSKETDSGQTNITNHGEVLPQKKQELIWKSRVNLQIAPRGFKDGIYGQALQIMGMRSFLITDYRRALEEEFVPGKDFIIFEDMKHLVHCAGYYLEHSKEREEIALSAYEKIEKNYSLEQRIEEIENRI